MRALIVLDRDGTIIKNNDWIGKENDWREKLILNTAVVEFLLSIRDEFQTTIIVVTNQAGVARGYFDENRVKEVNAEISNQLSALGVTIASWQYVPHADVSYVKTQPDIAWRREYIRSKTDRKPSPTMVISALQEIGANLSDFEIVCVLGDRHEDAHLALNLSAYFIDVKEKSFEEILLEFHKFV